MPKGFKRGLLVCLLAALLLDLSQVPIQEPLATSPNKAVSKQQETGCLTCHAKPVQPALSAKQPDQAPREQNQPPAGQEKAFAASPVNSSANRLNILLLGVDTRANDSGRADSIILASIAPLNNSADVFSIMRDSYVTIPADKPTKNRINAAYGLGGPTLVKKTVSDFLQLPVNYYVVTDFKGFEKAVDAIGGVDLYVEKAMNYTDDGINDIHLKPGLQHLNGHQALGYARFRHDQQGDYARVARQRKLLKALLSKIQGIQAVYYLPRIISAIKPYIQTNLDVASLPSLAYDCYRLSQVKTYTLPSPTAHKAVMVDGMAVLLPDVNKTREEVHKILATDGK